MLKNGDIAPDFSSVDQNGNTVKLSDFSGDKNLVIYFYPKDDTPGCTIEAQEFTALLDEFTALDTTILGVSKDDTNSHCAFIEKYKLGLNLLADTSGQLCGDYGVWQEKERAGVKSMGIVRSTFVIDKKSTIRHAEYGVAAEGHAEVILDYIKNTI